MMSITKKTFNPKTTIAQIVQRIVASGKITRSDENYLLRITLADYALSSEELDQVGSVLDRLQMGLLKVVD